MTYEQSKEILANPGLYDPKFVEEAKKLNQEKVVNKESMSDEVVDAILANPDQYDPKYVQTAKDKKSIRNAGLSAPGKDWVRQYIPVNENGGFNFNWKQAYDQKVNPEDLKSIEKLDEFRRSKMWNVDDDVNLKNVATELHFMQGDEDWRDFLKSDRFKEFQNYLSDVRANQEKEAVDKIFGEDGSLLVDFMLPVSKEYAKRNYKDINGLGDLAGPLAADVGANVVMTGFGKGAVASKPILSHIYGNAVAPLITEAGNVAFNDKAPSKAAVNALEGYLVNRQTGKVIDRYIPKTENFLRGKVAERQKVIDDAVNSAIGVEKKMKRGATAMDVDALGNKTFYKWQKGKPVEISEDEFLRSKSSHITESEFENWLTAKESIRRTPKLSDIYSLMKNPRAKRVSANDAAKMIKEINEELFIDQIAEARNKIAEKINNGSKVTMEELRDAGLNNKESLTNFIRRVTNNSVGDYLTNAAGRPRFGQRGLGSFLETMVPGLDLFKDETENEKKSKLRKAYGL